MHRGVEQNPSARSDDILGQEGRDLMMDDCVDGHTCVDGRVDNMLMDVHSVDASGYCRASVT